jgi:hypothetical protein
VFSTDSGQPIVLYDPSIAYIDEQGYVNPQGRPGCNATENYACTCTSNRACMELERYVSVPAYLREAMRAYHLGLPEQSGLWD